MKKKFLVLGLTGLVTVSFFSNCSKKKETNIPTKTKMTINLTKIDADLKAINAKYLNKSTTSGIGHKTTSFWGKVCAVVGADLCGAAAGAELGGKIGGAIGSLIPGAGTAAGAGFGAGFGAGLTAGLASAGAANLDAVPVPIINTIGGMGTLPFVPNPYNNPYENVGIRHNQLLKQMCVNYPYSIPGTSTTFFNNVALSDGESQVLQADANNTLVGMINTFASNGVLPDYPSFISSQLGDNIPFGQDNVVYSNILSEFYQGFNGTFQVNDTYDMSVTMALINDYENYFITNTDNIDQLDQQFLLQDFAVAKYSLALWIQAGLTN